MANLTYRELWQKIIDTPNEKLDDTVTVYIRDLDEYYPISHLSTGETNGVLDDGHLFLVAIPE